MDNFEILQQLGLGDKEIRVYKTLLSLGPSHVALIAKEAGIKRSSTYFALSRLVDRGLVSQTEGRKKEVFHAENPEIFLRLARQESEKAKKLEREIASLIPTLKSFLSKNFKGPRIRILEGREGLWSMAEDTLKEKKDIYVIGSEEKLYGAYSKKRIEDYARRRQIRQIKVYVITDRNSISIQEYLHPRFSFVEYRFLPESVRLNSYFMFYGDKTVLITREETPVGIIIEDKAMTSVMKLMFDALWEQIERKNLPLNISSSDTIIS